MWKHLVAYAMQIENIILCLSILLSFIENQLDFGTALAQRWEEENSFYPQMKGDTQVNAV